MSSGHGRRKQGMIPGGRWLSPLLVLLIWEISSRTGLIPPRILAAPTDVFGTMFDMTLSGELPANLAVSLQRVGLGLSIGIAIGLVSGLVSGLSRVGEQFVDPLMQIKRTIPSLALTPLLILWL